jgi:hypothetical protein
MPYRTPPPKPITLTAADLLVAIDALTGSLRIHGSGMFRYTEKAREELRVNLIGILSATQYNVEMVGEQKQPSEA